jgi:hypothetical protein
MNELLPAPPADSEKPPRLPGGSYWLCEYEGKEAVAAILMTGKHFQLPGDTTHHKLASARFRHQLWPLTEKSHLIPIKVRRNGVWVNVDVFACTKAEIAEFFDNKGQNELRSWLWFLLGFTAACRSTARAALATTTLPPSPHE